MRAHRTGIVGLGVGSTVRAEVPTTVALFRRNDIMADQQPIHERYPHIVAWALPSPARHEQFVHWVLWDDGADDEGNLLGFCPLHDASKRTEGSAEFNFRKGIMRCQGDPCCHERRAMSLTRVESRMSDAK